LKNSHDLEGVYDFFFQRFQRGHRFFDGLFWEAPFVQLEEDFPQVVFLVFGQGLGVLEGCFQNFQKLGGAVSSASLLRFNRFLGGSLDEGQLVFVQQIVEVGGDLLPFRFPAAREDLRGPHEVDFPGLRIGRGNEKFLDFPPPEIGQKGLLSPTRDIPYGMFMDRLRERGITSSEEIQDV